MRRAIQTNAGKSSAPRVDPPQSKFDTLPLPLTAEGSGVELRSDDVDSGLSVAVVFISLVGVGQPLGAVG